MFWTGWQDISLMTLEYASFKLLCKTYVSLTQIFHLIITLCWISILNLIGVHRNLGKGLLRVHKVKKMKDEHHAEK